MPESKLKIEIKFLESVIKNLLDLVDDPVHGEAATITVQYKIEDLRRLKKYL